MSFMHYDHKIKHGDIVNMYISMYISPEQYVQQQIYQKKYQKVTDISDELIQNLYIQLQKRNYMEMNMSVNNHQTSENV